MEVKFTAEDTAKFKKRNEEDHGNRIRGKDGRMV